MNPRKELRPVNPYLDLFVTFAKVGGLTFGGGYAMLPILQREVVENRHWISEDELTDIYAVGQCTPGVIAVNTATFVGYRVKGVFGGVVATLGVVFPSLVIITLIAAFLRTFADIPFVKHAFAGIRVVVTVMVLNTVVKLFKSSVLHKPVWVWILFLAVLIASFFFGISSPLLVICAGIVGIVMSLWLFPAREAKK